MSLKAFRSLSLLEGLSYLAILSVTVGLIDRAYVFPLGLAHGILFMGYIALSLLVSHQRSWPLPTWLAVFLAAVVPFAFIAVDAFLRREIGRAEAKSRPRNGVPRRTAE